MKRKITAKTATKTAAKAAAKTATKTATKTAAKTATKPKRPRSATRAVTAAAEAQSLEALVAAGALALGIPLDPSWQASVTFNLRLILSHAAKVDGFPLSDDAEPAPVFHA